MVTTGSKALSWRRQQPFDEDVDPGPGSNVKSSSKSKNSNPNSQKCDFSENTRKQPKYQKRRKIDRGEPRKRPARRQIVRNLRSIDTDTRIRTEIPEKPWKLSRYSMEGSFQKQEFPNSRKRPPWKKDSCLTCFHFIDSLDVMLLERTVWLLGAWPLWHLMDFS